MFARRRPLLRAAAVGGGAYLAGKKNAQRSAEQQVPAQRAVQPSVTDQLAQLSRLHEQGALTDAEFAAAKARLIG